MIYLDNAATTMRKPQAVVDAVCAAMTSLGNSGRSANDASLSAARVLYGVREKLAGLFHCPRADHVCLTQNSTEALNIALSGLFAPGDHILSTDCEHNSVLRPLYRLQTQGVSVDFLPADRRGCIEYDDFPRLLRPNTRAIVCTHASNLTGNALDIEKIGAFAKKNGLLFLVDASQTAGLLPIDMEKQHIDVLCFTGPKSLYGPQGTGGLYIRSGLALNPQRQGGTGSSSESMLQPAELPERYESGTLNYHGIAGLRAGADYVKAHLGDISTREKELTTYLYEGLARIPSVTLYTPSEESARASLVSFNAGDLTSSQAADRLNELGFAVRGGLHCAPGAHSVLGTLKRGAVRASVGHATTFEELDAFLAAVRSLV